MNLAWFACLWRGHEPDERDWVGRPIQCARCGAYDAEMSRRAYLRFLGEAARRDWNRKAMDEMAWAEMAAAMSGGCEPRMSYETVRALRDVKGRLTPPEYARFTAGMRMVADDPELAWAARQSW